MAHLALAGSPARGQAQESASKSAGTSPEKRGSARQSARPQLRKPDASGNFVNEVLNTIRARSSELCSRYGSPDDCLEEAEVCLTMRNADDDEVRLCLNTSPGENDRNTARKARLTR
jgi:hypothetical protein